MSGHALRANPTYAPTSIPPVKLVSPTHGVTHVQADHRHHQRPAAIGTYSQAVKAGNTVYLSGQIGLDPATMQMVGGFEAQTVRVFETSRRWPRAAGGSLADAVKLNIYLTDLANFARVNEVMARFSEPLPGPRRRQRQGAARGAWSRPTRSW